MSNDRDGSLPVIDPATVEARRSTSVAGLLLAAGKSSRFESGNKLLATLDDEPVVRQAAKPLAEAGLEPRFAVLGNDARAVESALDGLGYQFLTNPDYQSGQSTSVRRGIDALSTADAVVIALGDMPRIEAASIRALVRVYRSGRSSAVAAACDGSRGNPVLFDQQYFEALADVDGDIGGREILLEGDESALVETDDPGVLRDIDTRVDLMSLRES